MGMFDTFVGEVRCPHCGKMHKFEEQTKKYNKVLTRFLLGDYIDKTNTNYLYPFTAYCYRYKQFFNVNAVIHNGQIIKFVNEYDIPKVEEIKTLNNIEEGLGHKLEYLERCKNGIGYNNEIMNFEITIFKNEEINWEEHPKKIGDIINTLNCDWTINEIYKEIFTTSQEDKCFDLYKLHYNNAFIYKVNGRLGNRIIRVTNYYYKVLYDNGLKEEYDSNNPDDFYIQRGCQLEKIE